MKWDDVIIKENEKTSHTGLLAWKFVEKVCHPIALSTTWDGLIVVNTNSPSESTEDKDVRTFLFSKLKGKAEALKFTKGKNFLQAELPLARSDQNVVNVNTAKLKILFIYKHDSRSDLIEYLKEPVQVSVSFAGNKQVPAYTATNLSKDGVIDLGVVPAGSYKLTPDYSKLEKCKFDFEEKPQDVYLRLGDDKTVIFEVEPLYQKVQLVAHCLLAVPDKTYEMASDDKDKLVITESNGRKEYKYKEIPVNLGRFELKDLSPALLGKATVTADPVLGIGTLTMKVKKPLVEYYQYDELPQEVTDKIEIVKALPVPEAYEVRFVNGTLSHFQAKFKGKATFTFISKRNRVVLQGAYTLDNLIEETIGELEIIDDMRAPAFQFKYKENITESALTPILGNMAKIERAVVLKLVMEPKRRGFEYWRMGDLSEQALEPEKLTIKNKIGDNPEIYETELNQRPASIAENEEKPTFKQEDLKGEWKGMYHGLLNDKDDMDARVKLVKATLDHAYTKANKDSTILKVFMLPECFFQGRYGAYLVEDADHLLTQLLDFTSDVRWRDWMFVFGTVNLTFGEQIREMMNYSPIIRGGIEPPEKYPEFDGERASQYSRKKAPTYGRERDPQYGGERDKRLRLMQKYINSAELLDENELKPHDQQTRKPSVNDYVQFQANQSENEVGLLLQKLLEKAPDFGAKQGLSKEKWQEVTDELSRLLKIWGLTRVVRYIRNCKVGSMPDDLKAWGDFSGYLDQTKKHLESVSCTLATWENLLARFIKDEWDNSELNTTVDKGKKLDTSISLDLPETAVKPVLEKIQGKLNELYKEFSITLPSQQLILSQKIRELVENNDQATKFIRENEKNIMQGNFGVSICPMMKKILELYCEEAGLEGVPLTPVVEKLDYRDYCFASRRKAGPWLSMAEVENLEPCKKLLFGVEICADHGEGGGKIKKILEEKPLEELQVLSPDLKPLPLLSEQTLHGFEFIKLQTDEEKIRLNEENAKLKAENLKIQNKNKKIREYNARVEKLKVKIEKEKARKLKENPDEKIDDDQFEKEQVEIENARIERKNAAIRKENARIEREKPHKEKVKIDIHLVPSAGFYPTALSIAARKGGYCFNCDGWNKGLKDGINRIEAWFDGPEYEKGTMKNPVTPHTAIAKGGGVPLDMKEFELPQDKKIQLESVIDRALGEGILNRWGLGELHVYDPLDLPKNPVPEAKQDASTRVV